MRYLKNTAIPKRMMLGQLLVWAILALVVTLFLLSIAGRPLFGYVFLAVIFAGVYTAARLAFDILDELFR